MADPNLPTIALVSLGCPKNLVDSERMLAGLALEGFAVTDDADGADLAIVNTCAFIDLARAESDREIDRLEDFKRAGRLGRIIVVGCMAQRYGRQVLERHKGVDAVAGLAERDRLADLCGEVLAGRAPAGALVRVGAPPPAAPTDRERLRLTPRHYAYLRITEGCDNRCAYCAIPEIRGPLRSKPPEEVLAEAREMVADAARELILIGQDTTAYGRDRSDGWTLARLLVALRRESGAEWIRLLYTHPASFAPEVVEELAAGLPLVPYVDMPLQHADDAILASMGRRVTRAGIEDLVGRLRAAVPGIALRTSFIVGYPGETEAAFETLLGFVEKVRFDHVGVFLYSREPETRAAGLEGQVPREIAAQRWDRLTQAAERLARESALRQVGRVLEVRVDGPSHVEGRLAARHAGQAPEIDSVVLLAGRSAKAKPRRRPEVGSRLAPGDRLRVRIVAADGSDLVAEPVRERQPGDPTP